ncbi:MAG: Hsp20/alpha crystallin family protein [Steroidobacterales bacterium]
MNVYRKESWMWAEACALLDEAERRHRQFFALLSSASRASGAPVWEPPANIFSDDSDLQVIVALPGAHPEDITVQLTSNGLQIETTVAPPALPAGTRLVRLEIPYGRMRRWVDLPPGRYALIERRFERGCLFVQLSRSIP